MKYKVCKICNGDIDLAFKSDSHYLCIARNKRSLHTPKLQAPIQDESFKKQQSKDIALFTYLGARMRGLK